MNQGQLQSLLQRSVEHYRALDALMQQIELALIAEDPDLLTDLQAQVAAVQEQARETDALIAPLLPDAPGGTLAALMSERKELLKGLQAQNRLISEKIRGILPVIADELGQLRAGQTAMTGYASGPQARGGTIRGAY